MRLLMIGAPGAGKGTQATRVADFFGITHISSGDLLRRNVDEGTDIGRAVEEYVHRGDLVPDEVVMDMLRKPVIEASETGGYVLDGFPRSVEQAEASRRTASTLGVEVQVAIHLDVPRDELVRRLKARGRGEEDTDDVIEHRIEVFIEKTRPMIEYYERLGTLLPVDGGRTEDEVSWALVRDLQKRLRAG
jgi:adenylate kinase